jgi:hypothetical protein
VAQAVERRIEAEAAVDERLHVHQIDTPCSVPGGLQQFQPVHDQGSLAAILVRLIRIDVLR